MVAPTTITYMQGYTFFSPSLDEKISERQRKNETKRFREGRTESDRVRQSQRYLTERLTDVGEREKIVYPCLHALQGVKLCQQGGHHAVHDAPTVP